MTVSEQRDGTGTGTWTHPAAETGPPEQRRQCPDCGGAGWHWNRSEFGFVQDACKRCGSTGHIFEPTRCWCGMCVWNGHRWAIAKSHNGEPGIALWGNDKGDVVCPGDCKCRLGVVDGQPIVRPPEQQRCECGACWWDGVQWVTRYFEAGDYPELHSELVVPVAHCPGECGCRLSVVDGEPVVGPSEAKLLAALYSIIRSVGDDACPMVAYCACPAPLAMRRDGRCPRPDTDPADGPYYCWLRLSDIADTDEQAAELWKRMEEAAR